MRDRAVVTFEKIVDHGFPVGLDAVGQSGCKGELAQVRCILHNLVSEIARLLRQRCRIGIEIDKNQVLDNMFWTCASGVTVWTAYEALMMRALANGYVPMLEMPEDFLWSLLLIFLIPIWETLYFYPIHRLIHWPPLYRHVHCLHHRNTNIGPWSGLSMHPVEHIIYLGSVLIHWIVPANPLLIIYHLQHYTLSAATTHTGYQGLVVGGKFRLALGTFHHQIHHRFFECNYGGLEIPCDKWAGSFHDGTPESHQQFLEKRKLKTQRAQG